MTVLVNPLSRFSIRNCYVPVLIILGHVYENRINLYSVREVFNFPWLAEGPGCPRKGPGGFCEDEFLYCEEQFINFCTVGVKFCTVGVIPPPRRQDFSSYVGCPGAPGKWPAERARQGPGLPWVRKGRFAWYNFHTISIQMLTNPTQFLYNFFCIYT